MSAVLQLLNDYQTLIVIVAIGFAVYFYFQLKKDNQLLQKDVQNNYDKQQIAMDQIDKHLTNHVTETEDKIEKLEATMNAQFNKIESNMNAQFDKVDLKFDKIESKFNKVDLKFDKIESKFNKVDLKFDKIDSRFDSLFLLLSKESKNSDKE